MAHCLEAIRPSLLEMRQGLLALLDAKPAIWTDGPNADPRVNLIENAAQSDCAATFYGTFEAYCSSSVQICDCNRSTGLRAGFA